MVERPSPPRCATCAYWDVSDVEGDEGWCRRLPPRIVESITVSLATKDQDELESAVMTPAACAIPMTRNGCWCGEHPDFPAYLESLRKAKQ